MTTPPRTRINWHVGWNIAAAYGLATTVLLAFVNGVATAIAGALTVVIVVIASRSGTFATARTIVVEGGFRSRTVPLDGTTIIVGPAPLAVVYAQLIPGSVSMSLRTDGDEWRCWGAIGFGDPSDVVRRVDRCIVDAGATPLRYEVRDEDRDAVAELRASGIDVTLG